MVSQNNSTTNSHDKEFKDGLLEYFFPTNAFRNWKRNMCWYLNKPCALPMKIMATHMTELNNYLTLLPVSGTYNKMEEEGLNEFLILVVPDSWAKQSYLKG